jgi:predicted nucleic acid-binding protein
MESLTGGGTQVIVPEIADYELRRELLRVKKKRGLAHLERLISQIKYLPITTAAMRQAAAFWAQARQQGQPTAGDNTTDFVIATTNIRHLSRFVPADLWQNIY